jgi:hypothetical protein
MTKNLVPRKIVSDNDNFISKFRKKKYFYQKFKEMGQNIKNTNASKKYYDEFAKAEIILMKD